MNKFLTGDIWGKIGDYIKPENTVRVCIAYVTANNLDLHKNDILICDASDFCIKMGNTKAKVLKHYFDKGVKIYSNADLHSKMLITENHLVLGSANLSQNSAKRLIESAILTDNDSLISQAQSFFYNLKNDSEKVTREVINKLLEIEVVSQPKKPYSGGKNKTRELSFGEKYWFLNVSDLEEKKYFEVKPKLDKIIQAVVSDTKFEKTELDTIYFKKDMKLLEKFNEGDQLLQKWTNQNKNYYYPFTTILHIERLDEEVIIVYDNRNENKKIIEDEFLKQFNLLIFDKLNKLDRARRIYKQDAIKIKTIFNND